MKTIKQSIAEKLTRSLCYKILSSVQPGEMNRPIDERMTAFLSETIQAKLFRKPQLIARAETEKVAFLTNKKVQAVTGTTDKLFCEGKRAEFSVESRDATRDFGLVEEQDILLGRSSYSRTDDPRRGNGFKPFCLSGLLSSLTVRRPVLRGKTHRSPLLTALCGFGDGLAAALLGRFWLHGTSTRVTVQELNAVFGSRLNPNDVTRVIQTLVPDVNAWLQRFIPQEISFLSFAALYLPIRKPGFTSKQAFLAAVGLTRDGCRHILGFLLGDRENTDSWSALFKDLLERGLHRDSIVLASSDDHKAIRSVVDSLLVVHHQLCVVNKLRNALVRVAALNRKAFLADFKTIYRAVSKEHAFQVLGRLQAKCESLYLTSTRCAIADAHQFLLFIDHPQYLWISLRSSNIIERFNWEVRRRLRFLGALPSEFTLQKLLSSISTEQENRWTKRRVQTPSPWELAA